MTIAFDLGRKATKQAKIKIITCQTKFFFTDPYCAGLGWVSNFKNCLMALSVANDKQALVGLISILHMCMLCFKLT